jgi:hypothetical protein
MLSMILGAAFGAASRDAGPGAENAITFFAFGMLACVWLLNFHLKRQRDRSRERRMRR